MTHPKRPRDPNQLAKSIIDIADDPIRVASEGSESARDRSGRGIN
jgi:hypothetical protein